MLGMGLGLIKSQVCTLFIGEFKGVVFSLSPEVVTP